MASFTVKTAYYSGAAWTEATETNAVRYTLRNMMNQPCEAVVTLNDPNFASTQKYIATGVDTYFGLQSRLKITDTSLSPTTEFNGVIVDVRPNPVAGTVDLHCRDWLEQLNTEDIIYDTRVDLGSGVREGYPYRMDDTVPAARGCEKEGANDYRLYDTVNGGAWVVDQWNTGYYLVFSEKMAADTSFWVAANDYTEIGEQRAASTIDNTWFDDMSSMGEYSDNAGDDIEIACQFNVAVSSDKIKKIDLDIAFMMAELVSGEEVSDALRIAIYDFDAAGWTDIEDFTVANMDKFTIHHFHYSDLATLTGVPHEDMLDIAATDPPHPMIVIKLESKAGVGNKSGFALHYIRLTIHTDGVTPNATAYDIDDTGADYIQVSEDLVTADIGEHCPYSVCQVVTVYVADLVTTYDAVTTLDAATDLTASTTPIARHFHYTKPLKILRSLALVDGTEFWLDEDLHLHWNEAYTFAEGPANYTALTDSDVLYWMSVYMGTKDLANEVIVQGIRVKGDQVSATSTDATSVGHYGTYTRVENNPQIYFQVDADTYAASLKNRYKDPVLHVGYATIGSDAYRVIGDLVKVTSTDLSLSAVEYVVTETRYDSTTGVQQVFLSKKSTTGLFIQRQLQDGTRHAIQEAETTRRHVSFDQLHKETWS